MLDEFKAFAHNPIPLYYFHLFGSQCVLDKYSLNHTASFSCPPVFTKLAVPLRLNPNPHLKGEPIST